MGRRSRPQPKRLASKLKYIREHLRMTQAELALQLTSKDSPVRPGHISDYELDKRQPSLLVLLKYSRIAGVHAEDLIDDAIELSLVYNPPSTKWADDE